MKNQNSKLFIHYNYSYILLKIPTHGRKGTEINIMNVTQKKIVSSCK